MPDDLDAVQEREHLEVEEKREALSREMEKHWDKRRTGTCLFCEEACAPEAVLHPHCIEDYNKQQRMRQHNIRVP